MLYDIICIKTYIKAAERSSNIIIDDWMYGGIDIWEYRNMYVYVMCMQGCLLHFNAKTALWIFSKF